MPQREPNPRIGADASSVTRSQHRVTLVAAGIIFAVLAMLAWSWAVRTIPMPAWFQALASYLVVWIPLGVALVFGARAARRDGDGPLFARPMFRLIDVLWGVGAGLLMRGVTAGIEVVLIGRMSGGGGVMLEIDPTMAWFILLVAPVIIGPVIEECFFRGFTLPAMRDATDASGARRSTATAIAVIGSAALFALLHTLESTSPTLALVTGLSTFAFGLVAGLLVVFTNRLGGAIVAHVVYNGSLILLIVT